MSTRHTERRKRAALRWTVIGLTLVFFLIPLYGMLEFTTRDLINGGRTGKFWTTLVDVPQVTERYPALAEGFASSMALALFTVVVMLLLLVPTMTWVRLRLPGLTRTVEFICLLPLTVPAIVLVVGLTPVYAWVTYLLGEGTVWLGLAYVILVLPYAYRSLDAGLRAIDVKTLSEAARSLGASWLRVMWQIVLPNLRTAVLSASFLSVALVLGEFTIGRAVQQECRDRSPSVARRSHDGHALPRRLARHRGAAHGPHPGVCRQRPRAGRVHLAHRPRRVRRIARAIGVWQDDCPAVVGRARGRRRRHH